MIDIIIHTPLYVWPLLIVLLIGGFQSFKKRETPIIPIVLVSIGFFTWNMSKFFQANYFSSKATEISNEQVKALFFVSILIGGLIGYFTLNRNHVRLKSIWIVELPGSYIPLILSLGVFSCRYILGALNGINHPILQTEFSLALEVLSTIFSGAFLGRVISIASFYKNLYKK